MFNNCYFNSLVTLPGALYTKKKLIQFLYLSKILLNYKGILLFKTSSRWSSGKVLFFFWVFFCDTFSKIGKLRKARYFPRKRSKSTSIQNKRLKKKFFTFTEVSEDEEEVFEVPFNEDSFYRSFTYKANPFLGKSIRRKKKKSKFDIWGYKIALTKKRLLDFFRRFFKKFENNFKMLFSLNFLSFYWKTSFHFLVKRAYLTSYKRYIKVSRAMRRFKAGVLLCSAILLALTMTFAPFIQQFIKRYRRYAFFSVLFFKAFFRTISFYWFGLRGIWFRIKGKFNRAPRKKRRIFKYGATNFQSRSSKMLSQKFNVTTKLGAMGFYLILIIFRDRSEA